VRIDDPADDFRSKLVEADVLASLFDLLQDDFPHVRRSAIEAITALAKFGGLIYHFVLRDD
jgi:hypothetical protein